MKMKKILLSLSVAVLAFGGLLTLADNNASMKVAHASEGIETFNADVSGGAKMSYGPGTDTGFIWLDCFAQLQTSTGNGVYFRIRNFTGVETPLATQLADGYGSLWGVGAADLKYYLYSADGYNEVEKTYLYTTMIQIPAYFDGIVYLPYANYTSNLWVNGKENNWSLLWFVQLGIQPLYNSFANYTVGDMFTGSNLNTDVSSLDPASFGSLFQIENFSDGTANVVQDIFTDFNPIGKDYLGGNVIRTSSSATNQGPRADVASAAQPIFGSYIYMRVINYGGDLWPMLEVTGCDGDNSLPEGGKPFYYYDVNGANKTTIAANPYNGFCIPANFDGFISVPLGSLYNSTMIPQRFDWIYGIFVTVDAAVFQNAEVIIGDVFSFNNLIRDGSASTHVSFSGYRNVNLACGSVLHYPGFADELATGFAEDFLTFTYPCDTAAASVWADVAEAFNGLSAADKALLIDAIYSGKSESQLNLVEKAMQRYDLAVSVQGLSQFVVGRTVASNITSIIPSTSNFTINIVVVISLIMLSSIGLFFFFRKKKTN